MKRFTHIQAESLDHAVQCLQEYKDSSFVVAGGSDLMGCLKDSLWMQYPEAVINLKSIEGLNYIKVEDSVLEIGGLTTLSEIAESSVVKDFAPALAEAARKTASPLLRNIGTIAGNICQENRCWYYRYPNKLGGRIECVRKGGKRCLAVPGEHRYHSIFGAVKGCIAVNPSDTAPALIALKANIKTTKRVIPADEFFSASNGQGSTVLDRDEIVVSISIAERFSRSIFQKIALRKSIDFAILNCAIAVKESAGKVQEIRICLNGVHNNPRRCVEVEEALIGESLTENVVKEVCELVTKDAKPLIQNIYKVQMAKTIVNDCLLAL